jgi:hypothetical protein
MTIKEVVRESPTPFLGFSLGKGDETLPRSGNVELRGKSL